MTAVGRALAAGAVLSTVFPTASAFAQGERAAFAADQCAAELGLTEAECTCVIEAARGQLSPRQVDYLMVRVARNDAEVARMRTFMPLGERLAIFFAVQRAVGDCAPGKDVAIPSA